MASFHHELPADDAAGGARRLIDRLNADPAVHGILVQLPLPERPRRGARVRAHRSRQGRRRLPSREPRPARAQPARRCAPCTPAGVIELLDRYEIAARRARKPSSSAAATSSASRSRCCCCTQRDRHHRATRARATCRGDARAPTSWSRPIGRAAFVNAEMVKPGAVVIDVGINRTRRRQLVGDVDFDAVAARSRARSRRCPGGVGPMTIAMLLANTLQAARAAV